MAVAVRPQEGAATPVPAGPVVPAQHPIVRVLDNENARELLKPFIPSGMSFDRVLRETYIYATEHPEVLKCTAQSLVRGVAKVLGWGLTLGETAHLVPFNVKVSRKGEKEKWETRAQALQDYKGKIHLIVRSGAARMIVAKCVYEQEIATGAFEYREGTNPEILHRPILDPKQRGELAGAYAWAKVNAYAPPIMVVMSIAEIDGIRQRYSKQWKKDADGRPIACPPWYAMKTCVHQLAKYLPKSPRLEQVLGAIDDEIEGETVEAFPDHGPVAEVAAPGESGAESTGASGADGASLQRGEPTAPPAEVSTPSAKPQHATGGPACPECGGAMWDNRQNKRNPRAPDFKCKDRNCEGVIWPPKDGERRDATGARRPAPNDEEAELVDEEAALSDEDEIPF